jgi:transcriptional regulator with XRE-family HTH domain
MNLQEYRKTYGVTYSHIAKECNVGVPTISNVANGVMQPSFELAIAIEKATKGYVGRENWYPSDDSEINLDQATINFFQAVFRAGAVRFGHPRFLFRVEVTFGSNHPKDAENIQILNQEIQRALDLGNEAVRHLTDEDQLTPDPIISVERTTAQ